MEEYDDLVPDPGEDGVCDMTSRGWKHLDDIVWKMGTKILTLNVSYNQIVEIPEQISDLILLKDLNIAYNDLKSLPKSIGDLRCLRRFQCQFNKLEVIPEEIGKCHMLEDLVAHDNRLVRFPASIAGCAALNVCDLRNNNLTEIPCELGSLVTMRNLTLVGNENMGNQIPSYCLDDSSLCIFLLKKEFDFREETKTLKKENLELEYEVRNREEYNLRIKDEWEAATDLYKAANKAYPHEYFKCKAWCRRNKGCCCCCVGCAIC